MGFASHDYHLFSLLLLLKRNSFSSFVRASYPLREILSRISSMRRLFSAFSALKSSSERGLS